MLIMAIGYENCGESSLIAYQITINFPTWQVEIYSWRMWARKKIEMCAVRCGGIVTSAENI